MSSILTEISPGGSYAHATTFYNPYVGTTASFSTTEADGQITARVAQIVKNLWVMVTSNSLNSASTINSRHNGAAGNLTISVAATATGTFQDTTHSDSIAAGDTFNFQIVAGGTAVAEVMVAFLSVNLVVTSSTTWLMVSYESTAGVALTGGTTQFFMISGDINNNSVTETVVQWTIRFGGTWSNLTARITASTTTLASTVNSRIGAANGTQTLSIAAATTGTFEDTTHTDAIVAGNLLDTEFISGGASTGSITIARLNYHFKSTNPNYAWIASGAVSGQNFGVTQFKAPAGNINNVGAEASEQLLIRNAITTLTVQDLYVRVTINSVNGTTTVQTRKNGANGTLVVSIGAAATGVFEDTTHSDSLATGDLYCTTQVTAGTSGTIDFSTVSEAVTTNTPAVIVAQKQILIYTNMGGLKPTEGIFRR